MDGWHFPRTDLANHYLSLFDLGISSSFALIAPRRKGKTLFILRDLAPAANKKKYLPVYASLWSNINAPHEGLIQALEEAIAAQDKKGFVSRLLQAKIKKATLSNELLGRMEVEFAGNPEKVSSKELTYLDQLLTTLTEKAGKRTVLLLIDEVQHLSTSPAFDPLTHALRTMLDKRQGQVKSMFTGSSRHYMNLLFNESQSPFYHFSQPLPFPDLDRDFLTFLQEKLASDHHLTVSVAELSRSFSQLDQSPYWMMKLITRLVTARTSCKEALEYVTHLIEAAEDYEGLAKQMKPADRLIFLALCDGENPFSQTLLQRIDQQTSVKGVASNIQRSLQRLQEQQLISQPKKGEYQVEKSGLERFLRTREKPKSK